MAYDDKELKINGDIYRRHEGVLEVCPEYMVLAGEDEWFYYGDVDEFDDLGPCFESFSRQVRRSFDYEMGCYDFRPKYTIKEWEELFKLAIYDDVIIKTSSSDNDERFSYSMIKNKCMIIDNSSIYLPRYKYSCDKPDNLTQFLNNYRHDIEMPADFFLEITWEYFPDELKELFNKKLDLAKKIKNRMIGGLSTNEKNRIIQCNDIDDFENLLYSDFKGTTAENILRSDLFADWFDETYRPVTNVYIPGLNWKVSYLPIDDAVIFHISEYTDVVCCYCHDLDILFNELSLALRRSRVKITLTNNIDILKKAVLILFLNNYSEIMMINNVPKHFISNEHFIPKNTIKDTYFISDDEINQAAREFTVKEFDLRYEFILSLKMKCKIKNLKLPVLHKSGIDGVCEANEYTQSCIVYDDNTNKTIKAMMINSIADFDKWENVDTVEIYGYYDLRKDRPLIIEKMKEIKQEDTSKIIPNRNQETPGYDNWRDEVIKRDKICQCCGFDKNLEAHHSFGYKEYPELATDINNGIVLCKHCHDKYHSIYGLKNINPRDLVEFIKKFGVK